MTKIELTVPLTIGDKTIDEVIVKPLFFADLVKTWAKAEAVAAGKPDVAIQRERIRFQAHFMSGAERIVPDEAQIRLLPIQMARAIIDVLHVGQGTMGKLINDGDGVTKPLLYKLGTPVEMKSGKDSSAKISELEFKATTYGELEDVLAAGADTERALELLRSIAKPVEIESLMRVPGWALDRITVADGVGIMNMVLPRF
jgi:hypothetical protein